MAESCKQIFTIILFWLTGGIQIGIFFVDTGCHIPIRITLGVFWMNLGFLMFFSFLGNRNVCPRFIGTMIKVTFLVFSLAVFVCLAMLALILIDGEEQCMDYREFLFTTMFFTMIAWLILKVISMAIKQKIKMRRANKLKTGIDRIYKDLEKKKAVDVEKLIKTHGEDIINMFDFTPKEREILKAKFCVMNTVDQAQLPDHEKKSCVICLGDFEKQELIMLHPGCKHTFHDQCIMQWLQNNKKCPTCKAWTRSNMLRNICQGNTQEFAARDQVLQQNQFAQDDNVLQNIANQMVRNENQSEARTESVSIAPQNPAQDSITVSDSNLGELSQPLIEDPELNIDTHNVNKKAANSEQIFQGGGYRIGGEEPGSGNNFS